MFPSTGEDRSVTNKESCSLLLFFTFRKSFLDEEISACSVLPILKFLSEPLVPLIPNKLLLATPPNQHLHS